MATEPDKQALPSPRRGRPRAADQNKVKYAILEAALRLFRSQGLAATSIEQVAAATGSSKTTIYRHFGSKETLAQEAVAFDGQKVIEVVSRAEIDADEPLGRLRQVTDVIADFASQPSSADLYRFSIAAVPRVPAVGRAFAETGAALRAMMLPHILEAQRAGSLRQGNPEQLARQLYDAVIGPIWSDALLLEPYVQDSRARQELVNVNWDAFLRGAQRN